MLEGEQDARAFVAARCDSQALDNLHSLAARLRRENETQNLVARSTVESIWLRHIADSAQLLDHVGESEQILVSRETGVWLDIGSGAGFPGLVISIMRPAMQVVLVESRRLRIGWLESLIAEFDLRNCRVAGRDIGKVEPMDAAVISARAFAPLARLIDVSARFSTNSTAWVLPKGRSASQDVAELPASLRKRFHVKQSQTDPEAQILVARGQMRPRT